MARICEYCGLSLADGDSICPNCGAPAPGSSTTSEPDNSRPGIPQTISELRAFCSSHRMPLEQMRFFIGQNLREPRVFGIYRDNNGDYVVYKNKADGTRAVRYRGPDEAYAVREIYLKLKDETERRFGTRYVSPTRSNGIGRKKSGLLQRPLLAILVVFLGVSFLFAAFDKSPSTGYYHYNDDYYYYQHGDWYYYNDNMLDWVAAGIVDQELQDHYSNYYESSGYRDSYEFEDFRDSDYYEPYSDSSSLRDDDDYDSWDNDYDSWDAGDTDWDSDW